jgi:glucose/arabinose dehydrogenase
MAALALAAVAPRAALSEPFLPPGFVAGNVAPGVSFSVPTSMAVLPDGRLLVAEKSGTVWVVKSGVRHATPFWDGEREVLDSVERGLLGIAVDPGFATNRSVYFLYSVDPDSDGVDFDEDDAFGRLTRYQMSASDSNAVDPASRAILMGVDWPSGPPSGSFSHHLCALRFGRDGSLLVGIGDGAQFSFLDPGGFDPGLFGPGRTDALEDIGAFRAQYLASLSGKLLRIDPATGHGYPSNPFWDGDPMSVRSRIWLYGLRNPFRFAVRPGTGSTDPADGEPGTLYIGDVGWLTWEESNVARDGGLNFGWPCHEGFLPQPEYQAAAPPRAGCGTIGTPENPSLPTAPTATWNRDDPGIGTPPGFTGATSIGGTFYTGTNWPAPYHGRYFFSDYGEDWLQVMETDSLDQLVSVSAFGFGMDGASEIVPDPFTGDFYYTSLYTGEVRRIRWAGAGGNTAPVAVASATPDSGSVPFEVAFSGAASSDADGDSLRFLWLFGDGATSTAASPTHTYVLAGTYSAILVVDDFRGGIVRDTIVVRVTADFVFPTTALLDRFDRPNGAAGYLWAGDTSGVVVDANALAPVGQDVWIAYQLAAFGPLQEAYATFVGTTPFSPTHGVVLKARGLTRDSAHVVVQYDDFVQGMTVLTWTPGAGYEQRGDVLPVPLLPGDQFGARAYPNGVVEVFRNNLLVGAASLAGWPWRGSGGYVGLAFSGAYVTRVDDFGGGDANPTGNRPPLALVAGPPDTSFYAPGDTLRLWGGGLDPDDPPDSLAYHWSVYQRRGPFFPSVLQADARDTALVTTAQGEGLLTFYELRLFVTDPGSLSSSEAVHAFPDADLSPGEPVVTPPLPAEGSAAAVAFRIRNLGHFRPLPTRWRLVVDGTTIAEGDTTVAALDSVLIARPLPATLAQGIHALRVVADTLRALVEPDESNNGVTRPLTIGAPVAAGAGGLPVRLALSAAYPNPSRGAVHLDLALPRDAGVEFAVHDLQGRVVWSAPRRPMPAGRHSLEWSGADRGGAPARPGVYLAVVRVGVERLVRRVALVR